MLTLLRLAAAALLMAAAAPATSGLGELPDCSRWESGDTYRCPLRCKLWDSPTGPVNLDMRGCVRCVDGFNQPLSCDQCKLKNVHITYDSYRTECLKTADLGCSKTRLAAGRETQQMLRGPCTACPATRVLLWATARAEDFTDIPIFPPDTPDQARRAAAASVHIQVSSSYFPEINDTGSDTMDARSWTAHAICMTCQQLGCPGACNPLTGCSSCPAGSVLLRTLPPGTADTFKGEVPVGYYYGFDQKPAPQLPNVCLSAKTDLNCAMGQGKKYVGCTACAASRSLKKVQPRFMAGSKWLQLQAEGMACVGTSGLNNSTSPPPPAR